MHRSRDFRLAQVAKHAPARGSRKDKETPRSALVDKVRRDEQTRALREFK